MTRSSSILTSPARWVDEVIAGAVDLDDIRARLRATMDLMARQRLDAITRGDHLAAERADDALEALRNRLAALLH